MKSKTSQQTLSRPRKYRTSWRIRMLSRPRLVYVDTAILPVINPTGVRKSAILGECPDRVVDLSYPLLWRLAVLKKQYGSRFEENRLNSINALIESGNATIYTKLANSTIDLKKAASKKKSKAWNESEWKKHMDYISPLAEPKPIHYPPKRTKKKKWKPLPQLLPRINTLSKMPPYKVYKRLSQEEWYRDPIKVRETALKYVPSERMKILAKPKEIPTE